MAFEMRFHLKKKNSNVDRGSHTVGIYVYSMHAQIALLGSGRSAYHIVNIHLGAMDVSRVRKPILLVNSFLRDGMGCRHSSLSRIGSWIACKFYRALTFQLPTHWHSTSNPVQHTYALSSFTRCHYWDA